MKSLGAEVRVEPLKRFKKSGVMMKLTVVWKMTGEGQEWWRGSGLKTQDGISVRSGKGGPDSNSGNEKGGRGEEGQV